MERVALTEGRPVMADRGTKTQDKRATLLLRGANGMLYRIPTAELVKYAVPPEDLDKTLKSLEAVNPLLAAQDAGGGAVAAAPQVVINIYTSAEGPAVSIAGEAASPVARAYNAAQLPTLMTGPARVKKPGK
jgi:hypothetical protein